LISRTGMVHTAFRRRGIYRHVIKCT